MLTEQINLDETRIRAPSSGRTGTATYTPGAVVTANQDAALTTIEQLEPFCVDVTQTSAQLLALRKQIDSGALKAVNGRVKVKIILEDGSTYDRDSNLAFVGASVSTGNRSEEHTYELQSLMRISYAVLCLKKKNKSI